jgi:hypothetical protein
MAVNAMLFRRWKRPKTVDVVFPVTIGIYALWPWWAMHGGPQPPKDLGTVVMGVLGWFGTSKALDTGKAKAKIEEDDDEKSTAADDKPHD